MKKKEIASEIAGFLLLLLAVFAIASMLMFDANDPPRPNYPANTDIGNRFGIVGAYLSYYLLLSLGISAYVLFGVIGLCAIFILARRKLEARWTKLVGGAVLTLSVACLASLVNFPIIQSSVNPSGGGLIGLHASKLLKTYLGDFGTLMVVGIFCVLAALLSANTYLYIVVTKLVAICRGVAERVKERREQKLKAAEKPPEEAKEKPKSKRLRAQVSSRPVETAFDSPAPLEEEEPHQEDVKEPEVEEEKGKKKEEAKKEPIPIISMESEAPDASSTKDATSDSTVLEAAATKLKAHDDYKFPPLSLLDEPEATDDSGQEELTRENAEVLENTLKEFGVGVHVEGIRKGPVVTQYELALEPGVKVSKITALSNDISMAIKAPVRVVPFIPGKSTVGIEVPNVHRSVVRLSELLRSTEFKRRRWIVPMFLGKDVSGRPVIADLTEMPHLLIAGATGSGKSVCINTILCGMLVTAHPDNLKLIMVDPKMVELAPFKDIPHLLAPVVIDMKKAPAILSWAAEKMDERYDLLSKAGVNHIAKFNRLGEQELIKRLGVEEDDDVAVPTHLPYIVIVIDELADLIMVEAKEVEHQIIRLAQKSRAVGIHLVMATQRPSADVITGLIKSNLPSRIGFHVSSRIDSRVILDEIGAEKLLGKGDMLFMTPGTSKLTRAQGSFVSDSEVSAIVDFVKQQGDPEYNPEIVQRGTESVAEFGARDELFDQAVTVILETQRGSVSLLQRRLEIGYSRAARLVDMMAEAGIVGEYKGSQAREVMMTLEEWENRHSQMKPSEEPDPDFE